MPCPLTNFGQSSVTLSPHSTTTSSKNPALGDVQRPSTCHASSSSRLLPCPTHLWSQARTLWRHQRQRRWAPADAAAAAPAPPPASAAEAAAPPEKPALPTPPANNGRGGNQIGGRACSSWLKHAWASISVIRCCSLQYSAIGRAELQQRIQPQGSIPRYKAVWESFKSHRLVRTGMYWSLRFNLYIPVTGMYHFEVSRTALYPLRYVPARTSTYHRDLVLPCTRGTGFQMMALTPPSRRLPFSWRFTVTWKSDCSHFQEAWETQ